MRHIKWLVPAIVFVAGTLMMPEIVELVPEKDRGVAVGWGAFWLCITTIVTAAICMWTALVESERDGTRR